MTDCTCPPSVNIGCDVGDSYYSIATPECFRLPQGSLVPNGYYDSENNISYFAYEVLLSCNPMGPSVQSFQFFICDAISSENILDLSLLLSGCSGYQSIMFHLDSIFEDGFQYLVAEVNELITPGSAGIFVLTLAGEYPPITPVQPVLSPFIINLDNGEKICLNGSNSIFAGCPAAPRLTVTKTCIPLIENNSAVLNYRIVVSNTGDRDLSGILYNDTLNYNGANVSLGNITTFPDTINVDTSIPGVVFFTGNLGDIPPGDSIVVLYTIPIDSFNGPNTYTFSNMAIARSGIIESADSCRLDVEVVALSTSNCCTIENGNLASFTSSVTNLPNSSATAVTLTGILIVPDNVVVKFSSFGNCTATLPDGKPVPVNRDISNTTITYICSSDLSENSTIDSIITFTVESLNLFTNIPLAIINEIENVILSREDEQILLTVSPLPNTVSIDVNSILLCESTI